MVQEILPLLPKELGTLALTLSIGGCLVGVGLWLLGSRFSRTLISLVLVSIGGWTGLFLPKWFGWAIDGWAPAIGLALVLGATGFFLHRMWVGLGLGLVLAIWAAVITWMLCSGGAGWSWPKFTMTTHAAEYGRSIWQGLPVEVQKILPFACGAALLSGICAALLWPRIGVVTLYSVAGVSLIFALGLSAINFSRPQWIGMLPARTSSQAMTLAAMVAFGALVQWRIAPKLKAASKGPKRKPAGVGHQ
jgi:hypothetical protein